MKEAYFSVDLIRFEAAFDTPIKDALKNVPLSSQIESLDLVVQDVELYAQVNNLPICRKTWESYRKQADWSKLAKLIVAENSTSARVKRFFGL